MTLNFYLGNLNVPDDVREYSHVDVYFELDSILCECYESGDSYPSRVVRVNYKDNVLKGVSFDG